MMKTSATRSVHRPSSDFPGHETEASAGAYREPVKRRARGFTLMEILITVSVIAALAVVTLPLLNGKGNAERLLVEATGRIRLRRLEARHLRPLGAPTAHEGWAQSPVIIDFRRLERTAPLRIDGAATNYDGVDAVRGLPVTHFDLTRRAWEYVYEGAPLSLPTGWQVVTDAAQLPDEVGLIKDSVGRVCGIPVSAAGFDARGRAWADRDGDGLAESAPEVLAQAAAGGFMPFWAIYFTDGETAVAVALYSTGVEEAWRWSPGNGWRGWRSRAVGE
jgi:prepilin-type N-terminal cleavage/methylation domain-containing protein